jgi:hypothetical protein
VLFSEGTGMPTGGFLLLHATSHCIVVHKYIQRACKLITWKDSIYIRYTLCKVLASTLENIKIIYIGSLFPAKHYKKAFQLHTSTILHSFHISTLHLDIKDIFQYIRFKHIRRHFRIFPFPNWHSA